MLGWMPCMPVRSSLLRCLNWSTREYLCAGALCIVRPGFMLLPTCRYLVYLTVITALAIILCQVICLQTRLAHAVSSVYLWLGFIRLTGPSLGLQYVPHAPPGFHGTDIYFYSRVAVVHMAIAVALVCDIAILPWCAPS